jgi:hypothetical protein
MCEGCQTVTSDSAETHILIQTLGCGDIIAPLANITLHMVGGTARVLLRDDIEWREISAECCYYLSSMLDYS